MNRKIFNLNLELLLKYNIDVNFDLDSDSQSDVTILKCNNYHWRKLQNISPNYELILQPVLSNIIKRDRPFTFLSGTRSHNPIEYQLYHQCYIYLIYPDNEVALESKNT